MRWTHKGGDSNAFQERHDGDTYRSRFQHTHVWRPLVKPLATLGARRGGQRACLHKLLDPLGGAVASKQLRAAAVQLTDQRGHLAGELRQHQQQCIFPGRLPEMRWRVVQDTHESGRRPANFLELALQNTNILGVSRPCPIVVVLARVHSLDEVLGLANGGVVLALQLGCRAERLGSQMGTTGLQWND